MQYNKSQQTPVTGCNEPIASSTGNVLIQSLTLSNNQKAAIKDFYSLNDAGKYKSQLAEMLSIYIASSCPEFGELSQEDINMKSLIIGQLSDLLLVIEPLGKN